MTDIARVAASLACCGGLFVLCAVAWAMCAVAGLADRDWGRTMRKKLMLLVKRPDGTVTPVPVDSVEEGQQIMEIARLVGNRDVYGTPVEMELVEYEDTPL